MVLFMVLFIVIFLVLFMVLFMVLFIVLITCFDELLLRVPIFEFLISYATFNHYANQSTMFRVCLRLSTNVNVFQIETKSFVSIFWSYIDVPFLCPVLSDVFLSLF